MTLEKVGGSCTVAFLTACFCLQTCSLRGVTCVSERAKGTFLGSFAGRLWFHCKCSTLKESPFCIVQKRGILWRSQDSDPKGRPGKSTYKHFGIRFEELIEVIVRQAPTKDLWMTCS